MRTERHKIRGNELAIPHVNLDSVKAWAKATFSKMRIVEGALCAATVSVIRGVLSSLLEAMENYAMIGTPPV